MPRVTIPICVFFVWCFAAFGQAPPSTPSFEVADVKVNNSGEVRMAIDLQPGGRLIMRNVPMKVLIMFAYHVRPEAVTKAPGWIESDRYDVVAKATPGTPPDHIRRMVQALLAERFKLGVHVEQRVGPAYALVLGKSGPKLQMSEPAPLTEHRCTPTGGVTGRKHADCRHLSMVEFAEWLQELSPRDFDVPVVDQTGLHGLFDFKLDWTPGASRATADAPADSLESVTIFQAVESQLGLKLQSTKLPLPVLAVDSVERVPIGN
jgi:uncharacterized protein (TIGR03435 family)